MSKRSQLVCQYLEKIDRKAIEKFPEVIRRYTRGRNGVYALYKADRLYYVGLATNLRTRLKQHLNDHHGESWDRFSVYLTIGTTLIKEMESLLLRIAAPPGNRQTGKFFKCENLERAVRSDIRTLQREEQDEIFGRRKSKATEAEAKEERRPVLAIYVTKRMKLRGRRKDKLVSATVRPDGSIRFKKRIFNSPSLAAEAALGHKKNGWSFWQYERAPGDWVRLGEFRKNH